MIFRFSDNRISKFENYAGCIDCNICKAIYISCQVEARAPSFHLITADLRIFRIITRRSYVSSPISINYRRRLTEAFKKK